MFPNLLTNLSPDKFRSKTKERPMVLLYPWCTYRNIFLALFLQNVASDLIYVSPAETNLSFTAWLKTLVRDDSVLAGSIENLKSVLDSNNPIQMGEAFAADLALYGAGQSLILFIDEFDRVIFDEDLKLFLQTLVSNSIPGLQIVINSRCLHLDTWYEMLTRGDICVLGAETRPDDGMFTIENKPRPQIEVYAFGQGHVFVNGQEITQWDGALPRNLFFYLMDHPMTTRDEIFEEFWPTLSVKEATNVFHVTKRKISERIDAKVTDSKSYELTQYKTGFYIPSDKLRRHYDVSEFQETIEQAMLATSADEEKALLIRAIAHYNNAFLTTISMNWSVERRNQLQQLYAQALISMGRLHRRQHEWQAALGLFVRALKQTPEREDIHREVMNIYREQGMYEDAARQYLSLAQNVHQSLHIAPARETTALYELIQAQR